MGRREKWKREGRCKGEKCERKGEMDARGEGKGKEGLERKEWKEMKTGE